MINIGVFFGGASPKHETSVITAKKVIEQLKSMPQYNPVPIYISKFNKWYTGDELLKTEKYDNIQASLEKAVSCTITKGSKNAELKYFPPKIAIKQIVNSIDLAFPLTGSLHGLFEMLDIPYIGANALAYSLTADKVASKLFLKSSGLNVIDGEWFYSHHWLQFQSSVIEDIESKLSYPLKVKPSDLSREDLIKSVTTTSELISAIDFVSPFTNKILIEKALNDFMEINISVVGDFEFLEFSLYNGSEISEEIKIEAEKMAVEAFIATECSGISTVSILIDKDTKTPYINELYTIPDTNAFSMWDEATHTEIMEKIIEAGFRAYRRRKNLINMLNHYTPTNLIKYPEDKYE